MNICKNFKFLRLTGCCMRNFADIRPEQKPTYTLEKLAHRELIRVHGPEVLPFLQGLVTNDVSHLQRPDGPSSIYAMFLNKGGRVLYDTIVYRTESPDTYLLECDREASEEFRRHLRTFRVRRKIDVDSIDDEYVPWVLFNTEKCGEQVGEKLQRNKEWELFISSDPRLPTLGTRILAPTDFNGLLRAKEMIVTPPSSERNYQLLRYKQGVGEGSEELPPGKCFPLEANADFLNGVSFNKGCYVGQELTARIHHSGVIRKRYMPIRLTAPLGANQTVQSIAGANLGRVFGHAHNHGVALLRIEQVLNGHQELVVDGERCFAERPDWWPSDLPSKRRQAFTD
ncbi:GL23521 [Drosophila persimilis]|uniref:GL23521 n=1 Tax=Drosophila persimilis TaxID=7234 RepID=B4G2Z4_DROPE|nr:putative transferase CAF17 homolog, mitochondrial [Drosophila persimilis]EDW24189.1 GL23521 [Drosophila persimilis]